MFVWVRNERRVKQTDRQSCSTGGPKREGDDENKEQSRGRSHLISLARSFARPNVLSLYFIVLSFFELCAHKIGAVANIFNDPTRSRGNPSNRGEIALTLTNS